jgi:hypothetical protein
LLWAGNEIGIGIGIEIVIVVGIMREIETEIGIMIDTEIGRERRTEICITETGIGTKIETTGETEIGTGTGTGGGPLVAEVGREGIEMLRCVQFLLSRGENVIVVPALFPLGGGETMMG